MKTENWLALGVFALIIIVYNLFSAFDFLARICTPSQAAGTVFFVYAIAYFWLVSKGRIAPETLDVLHLRKNAISQGSAVKYAIGKAYAIASFVAAFAIMWIFAGDLINMTQFVAMFIGMAVWGFTSLILMSAGFFGWMTISKD